LNLAAFAPGRWRVFIGHGKQDHVSVQNSFLMVNNKYKMNSPYSARIDLEARSLLLLPIGSA
jgi:hypothetical protein